MLNCPICDNHALEYRHDIYKDGRGFLYCDICGALQDEKTAKLQEQLRTTITEKDARIAELESSFNRDTVGQIIAALHADNECKTEQLTEKDARIAQLEEALKWQPIDTAPRDNKRLLYLARFNEAGKLAELDFDGSWEFWSESWEMSHINGYCWMSNNGIEEPTHWAYQDEPLPAINKINEVIGS